MIKLQEAELTSVLPAYIKENTDVQAISYAFQMGMRKFSQYVASSASVSYTHLTLPTKLEV